MADAWDRAAAAEFEDIAQGIVAMAEAAITAGDIKALFELIPQLIAVGLPDQVAIKQKARAKFKADLSLRDWNAAWNAALRSQEPAKERPEGEKPAIYVSAKQHLEAIRNAAAALHKHNEPPELFWRHGAVVHIRRQEDGRPVITPVSADNMMLQLSKAADFYRGSDERQVACEPPLNLCKGVLQLDAETLRLPTIRGVAEIPLFRPDGSLHDTPGYDPQTRMYFSPTCEVPPVPEDLTKDDVDAAVERIEDIIYDFPFVGEADKANTMAMLLCPVVRNCINGPTPAACIEAPAAGTGKSLLAALVSMLAIGDAALVAWKGEERENEVTITAAIRNQRAVVCLDNVTGVFGSSSLCAALTSTSVNIRPLGTSDMITVPVHTTWVVTANNLRFAEDMTRRIYKIRIDAKTAAPMQRTGFRHDRLIEHVEKDRGGLLHSLLVIAAWWFQCGKPIAPVVPLGSFESWHITMASILANAGVIGFLANLNDFLNKDENTLQWEAFLTSIEEAFGDKEFKISDIVAVITGNDSTYKVSMRETIPSWINLTDPAKLKHQLGVQFAKSTGNRVGDRELYLSSAGRDKQRVTLWKVVGKGV